MEIVNEASAKKNAAYVGRTLKVLVDGESKRVRGAEKLPTGMSMMSGRTDTFKLVNFAGRKDMAGEFVTVKITESNTFSLIGEVTE